MRKLLLLFLLYVLPANANIVPNFVQGNMQSTTNTTTTLTESITSKDFKTGYRFLCNHIDSRLMSHAEAFITISSICFTS